VEFPGAERQKDLQTKLWNRKKEEKRLQKAFLYIHAVWAARKWRGENCGFFLPHYSEDMWTQPWWGHGCLP